MQFRARTKDGHEFHEFFYKSVELSAAVCTAPNKSLALFTSGHLLSAGEHLDLALKRCKLLKSAITP